MTIHTLCLVSLTRHKNTHLLSLVSFTRHDNTHIILVSFIHMETEDSKSYSLGAISAVFLSTIVMDEYPSLSKLECVILQRCVQWIILEVIANLFLASYLYSEKTGSCCHCEFLVLSDLRSHLWAALINYFLDWWLVFFSGIAFQIKRDVFVTFAISTEIGKYLIQSYNIETSDVHCDTDGST